MGLTVWNGGVCFELETNSMSRFLVTCTPYKNNKWWPTVLTVEIEAETEALAKDRARFYAISQEMRVKKIKVAEASHAGI